MPHKSTEQVLQASEDRQSQVNQLVPIEATKAEDGASLVALAKKVAGRLRALVGG